MFVCRTHVTSMKYLLYAFSKQLANKNGLTIQPVCLTYSNVRPWVLPDATRPNDEYFELGRGPPASECASRQRVIEPYRLSLGNPARKVSTGFVALKLTTTETPEFTLMSHCKIHVLAWRCAVFLIRSCRWFKVPLSLGSVWCRDGVNIPCSNYRWVYGTIQIGQNASLQWQALLRRILWSPTIKKMPFRPATCVVFRIRILPFLKHFFCERDKDRVSKGNTSFVYFSRSAKSMMHRHLRFMHHPSGLEISFQMVGSIKMGAKVLGFRPILNSRFRLRKWVQTPNKTSSSSAQLGGPENQS